MITLERLKEVLSYDPYSGEFPWKDMHRRHYVIVVGWVLAPCSCRTENTTWTASVEAESSM